VLVEIPRFGRKGALAVSTILTGVFLYATTTAKTSNALLGWNCAYNFFANIMYAVLYAYTPEIFPTKDRGTGNALTASTNRIFGIMAVSASLPYSSSQEADHISPSLRCSQTCRPQLQSTPVEHCSSLPACWWFFFHSSHKEKRVYDDKGISFPEYTIFFLYPVYTSIMPI
jgi:hypothetical protein